MRKHILLDCDGVLCDFVQSTLDFYKEHTGIQKNINDITEFDIFGCFGDKSLWTNYRDWANKKSFCLNLPAYESTKKVLDGLHKLGEVYIVTSPFATEFWHHERILWLENFGISRDKIVFAKNKNLVHGDILIDDYHHNANSWSEKWNQYSILVNRPWNKNFESHHKVLRSDIEHVVDEVKFILK